jgi:two-component system, cell cycle sensor histidine kinase and response regulator CckA
METQGTVMLVDDEEDIRDSASEYLAARGIDIITAGGAMEAIQKAADRQQPISVLVTDFFMPDMSGMELATHLTAAFPELRTLYITGFGSNVVVNGDLASEGAQWLRKPVSLRVLEAEVRKMLAETSHNRGPHSDLGSMA